MQKASLTLGGSVCGVACNVEDKAEVMGRSGGPCTGGHFETSTIACISGCRAQCISLIECICKDFFTNFLRRSRCSSSTVSDVITYRLGDHIIKKKLHPNLRKKFRSQILISYLRPRLKTPKSHAFLVIGLPLRLHPAAFHWSVWTLRAV
jgi:hypothetical protein